MAIKKTYFPNQKLFVVFKDAHGNFFEKIMTVFDNMVPDKTKLVKKFSQK